MFGVGFLWGGRRDGCKLLVIALLRGPMCWCSLRAFCGASTTRLSTVGTLTLPARGCPKPQCAGKWDNIKANSTRKMKDGPVLCPVAHIALGSSAGLGPNPCNSSQSTPVPSCCWRTQLMGLHPLGLITGHIPLANPGIALQRKPWKGQFNGIKLFSSPGWIK